MTDFTCPCGSASYALCCQPLHLRQQHAQSAEQLMRSRYSAFAKTEIDYIVATTAVGQQSALDVAALRAWSVANQWVGLKILAVDAKIGKRHASVQFEAHYHDGKQAQCHQELSYFVQQNQLWYFIDPTLDQKITLKQPCICDSGKKLKQCCAQFL